MNNYLHRSLKLTNISLLKDFVDLFADNACRYSDKLFTWTLLIVFRRAVRRNRRLLWSGFR